MTARKWELFDRVSFNDDIYIPYEWAGDGTRTAYAFRVGDKIVGQGEIDNYLLGDSSAECIGGIALADLLGGQN